VSSWLSSAALALTGAVWLGLANQSRLARWSDIHTQAEVLIVLGALVAPALAVGALVARPRPGRAWLAWFALAAALVLPGFVVYALLTWAPS
jgi:hypothetical protein